ncbi:BDN_1c_G0053290.mRNA.1.CDS.1 [Saccharomyces cerevisiae]|nr:BDN_1c_G0053290.mRNA.1.CDS.1 [Saccharomyces cerevisiae]CAI7370681.1 BDN_1c_G0053290.mRNA.1.CDS.1 [Saccharomyces cerevisiae]
MSYFPRTYAHLMRNVLAHNKGNIYLQIGTQLHDTQIKIRFNGVRYISRNHGGKQQHINTAPIEFTPNFGYGDRTSNCNKKVESTAMKTLRCTDDISNSSGSEATTDASTQLPFNVKLVDPMVRKSKRPSHAISEGLNMKTLKKKVIMPYLQLTKPRLTILVMLSAICSYALSPYPASVSELLCLTVGTTLCSGSANAINMGREPEFDRQMVRTQARPVVRGDVTPTQAFEFAALIGTLGVSILYFGVNPTVAILGASNIALYGWAYTSMKRKHIVNTWLGALVGMVPPLMGWAAASPLSHPGSWCLAGLLFAWQFPHFNTLSHNIRNEYKNAGYVMTAWKNPLLNARVSLRYSILMFPLCFGLSYFNITDWYYQIDSGLINAWLTFWAFKFYWQQRINYSAKTLKDNVKFNKGLSVANIYARKTFMASVLHLPAILILAIIHKKGRWDWIYPGEAKRPQERF